MQYILIIIGIALIAPYIVWFVGAKVEDWITSIVFLVFFPLVTMYGRYLVYEIIRKKYGKPLLKRNRQKRNSIWKKRRKEDDGTLLRHKSFDVAYDFTNATFGILSICGFFYLHGFMVEREHMILIKVYSLNLFS